MHSLLLALAVAAAPEPGPLAVLVTSKRPGADQHATQVAASLFEAVRREKPPMALLDDATAAKELKALGYSDPRNCQGGKSCLAKLALLLGAQAVLLSVDVGKVGDSLAIHLEALHAAEAKPFHTADLLVPIANWRDASLVDVVKFARAALAGAPGAAAEPAPTPTAAAPAPPPKDATRPADAPTVAAKPTPLTPEPVREPAAADVPAVRSAPQPSPRIGAFVTGGAAVVCVGLAVALAVGGLSAKGQYDAALVDGGRATTLPREQAFALANSANTQLTVSLLSLIAGVGLGGLSTYLFLREAP